METQNQNLEKAKATRKAGGLLFTGSMFIGRPGGIRAFQYRNIRWNGRRIYFDGCFYLLRSK